ncbi:MAG: hypothetical protein IPO07_05305 [Haliscomenobacter sp.]|nr:hypothetical protein [Haliscomenobacter sp.]MBK9488262.1 hypothetical protein [Haliscomenobacter sp.]
MSFGGDFEKRIKLRIGRNWRPRWGKWRPRSGRICCWGKFIRADGGGAAGAANGGGVYDADDAGGTLVAISGEEEAVLMPLLQSLHEWSLCFWDGEGKVFEVHKLTREWMLKEAIVEDDVKNWAFAAGSFFREQPDLGRGRVGEGVFLSWRRPEGICCGCFQFARPLPAIGFYQKSF